MSPITVLLVQAWRRSVVYNIITDRFGRPSGSGDLCTDWRTKYCGGGWKGITDRLDYLAELGRTGLY